MNESQIKWQHKFANFEMIFQQLELAVAQTSYSNLEKAGLVQTFEFTFELAWKILQRLLQFRGYEVNGPRDVIKQAYKDGLITNGDEWLNALDNRNMLAHTYDVETSDEAVKLIKNKYYPFLKELHVQLKSKAII
jgi:nucleotidyltransferase substrate binding protein (TIGR01987 family)